MVSFLRVIGIVAAVQPALLVFVVPSLAATLVAVGYAVATVYWMTRSAGGGHLAPIEFINPFSLWLVVGFAAFLGFVIVAGHA